MARGRIIEIGNEYAIEFDSDWAESVGLYEGDLVELKVKEGVLFVTPMKPLKSEEFKESSQ
tara:strand:- start:1663 stop:1845 length:183 start_codon:yes stop_codon:yes gene_type:complete